jgi:ribosomal protein S18 acetylase RimI-like enzyme
VADDPSVDTRLIEVVPLNRRRLEEASRVLARAFHGDPAWKWIVPAEARRARILPWLFRVALRTTLANGAVDTTLGTVRGVALWSLPGTDTADAATERALIALPLRLRTSFGRFRAYAEWNRDLQLRACAGPALFLSGLGVDPVHQRRGVGSALLEAGTRREPRLPVVLLTNELANVRFYERHGFDVVLDEPMPHGLPTWAMVRRPPR